MYIVHPYPAGQSQEQRKSCYQENIANYSFLPARQSQEQKEKSQDGDRA
jgi:hypothetical protein